MNAEFFTANRLALLERLNSGALVVIAGYGEMQRGHDSAHFFEQEANFWYLTGVEKPGWWLILDGSKGTQWLVAPDLSDVQEVFDGGVDKGGITDASGIKTILSRDEALQRLRQLARQHSVVHTTEQPAYLREHSSMQLHGTQAELTKVIGRLFERVQICNKDLAAMRTIKRPEEVAAIRSAIDLTIGAFTSMKQDLPKARHEYELEARMTYELRLKGAHHAYNPIIASGLNACTLHYCSNDDALGPRDLVLFDVGARRNGYAADISRTYARKAPTKRQAAVHAAVREAQSRCIELLQPGVSFKDYEQKVETIMKGALTSLGLPTERYREYFPHSIGHGLGVDVHDPMAGYDSLQPGMVLTVEPGIYLRDEGVGVRIEDDILITEKGPVNLSAKLSTDL